MLLLTYYIKLSMDSSHYDSCVCVCENSGRVSGNQIKKIKSLLYSLNTLSGVTSERCPSPRLCAKARTIKVATVASR